MAVVRFIVDVEEQKPILTIQDSETGEYIHKTGYIKIKNEASVTNTITFKKYTVAGSYLMPFAYSVNGGEIIYKKFSDKSEVFSVDLGVGENIIFYGLGNYGSTLTEENSDYYHIDGTNIFSVSGEMYFGIRGLFYKSNNVIDASGLSVDIDGYNEYAFYNCENLISPASFRNMQNSTVTKALKCMYKNCYKLKTAPYMGVMATFYDNAYESMFENCYELEINEPIFEFSRGIIPMYRSGKYAYRYTFKNCKKLKNASYCCPMYNQQNTTSQFYGMFQGCDGLTTGYSTNTRYVSSTEYSYMFADCKNIVKGSLSYSRIAGSSFADYMYQNCENLEEFSTQGHIGSYMFDGCSKLKVIQANSVAPYSITSTAFQGVPEDCIIYVQDDSVENYRNAANWAARAAYIRPLSEKPTE